MVGLLMLDQLQSVNMVTMGMPRMLALPMATTGRSILAAASLSELGHGSTESTVDVASTAVVGFMVAADGITLTDSAGTKDSTAALGFVVEPRYAAAEDPIASHRLVEQAAFMGAAFTAVADLTEAAAGNC